MKKIKKNNKSIEQKIVFLIETEPRCEPTQEPKPCQKINGNLRSICFNIREESLERKENQKDNEKEKFMGFRIGFEFLFIKTLLYVLISEL